MLGLMSQNSKVLAIRFAIISIAIFFYGCQTTPSTPPMSVVPDVVGLREADAETRIIEAGLATGNIHQDFSKLITAGKVMSQVPVAGAQLREGSAVHLYISRGIRLVVVPDLIGKSQSDARTSVTEAGLDIGSIGTEFSVDVPKDEVIQQYPIAGTELPEGDQVDFIVSAGQQYATVSNVTERSQSDAQSILAHAGLTLGDTAYRSSSDIAQGLVISQDPPAGEELPYGNPVNLTLSNGIPHAEVPNVIGQQDYAAQQTIADAGFQVGTVMQEPSETVETGIVIRQDPQGGAEQAHNSQVSPVISSGALHAMVPNVIGRDQRAAESAIENAGLRVGRIDEITDATVPVGQVIQQDPPSNLGVRVGTEVILTISKGP